LKRRGRGRYENDKIPVMVIVSRYGGEEYIPMMSMEGGKIEEVVTSRIYAGSTIMTDEFKSYGILGYIHETVKHSEREYARGEAHINNCENRASLLRPWLSKHREISKDKLKTYLRIFKAHRNLTNKKPEELINQIVKKQQPTTL